MCSGCSLSVGSGFLLPSVCNPALQDSRTQALVVPVAAAGRLLPSAPPGLLYPGLALRNHVPHDRVNPGSGSS